MILLDNMERQRVDKVFERAQAIIRGQHFVYTPKKEGIFHGRDYVNKDAIYPHVVELSFLCSLMARHALDVDRHITAVVGPTTGGVRLAGEIASIITSQHVRWGSMIEVLAIIADEEDVVELKNLALQLRDKDCLKFVASGDVVIGSPLYNKAGQEIRNINYFSKKDTRRVIKPGYQQLVNGRRCLLVEDIINSGTTIAKTAQAVREAGGIVVGAVALCNRSGGKVTAQSLEIPWLEALVDLNMEMYLEDDCPICREEGHESVRTDLGKGRDFLRRKGLLKK